MEFAQPGLTPERTPIK